MKQIAGKVATHLDFARSETRVYRYAKVASHPGRNVANFSELQKIVAYLGYHNPGLEIFLRAQTHDHRGDDGLSSMFPSIYRGSTSMVRDPVATVSANINLLRQTEQMLIDALAKDASLPGRTSLLQHEEARWALLQHYRVCRTPLLDLTRSSRVAASFVVPPRGTGPGSNDLFIYIFGLPYSSGNITHNYCENFRILNLRGVLGHIALRPHEQEGLLAGSLINWQQYSHENNLSRRMLGKIRIPLSEMNDASEFWGAYDPIPHGILLPARDRMKQWLDRNGLTPDSV